MIWLVFFFIKFYIFLLFFYYFLIIIIIFFIGRDEDFSGMDNDALPDFAQLEHFINSDTDEHNKLVCLVKRVSLLS